MALPKDHHGRHKPESEAKLESLACLKRSASVVKLQSWGIRLTSSALKKLDDWNQYPEGENLSWSIWRSVKIKVK